MLDNRTIEQKIYDLAAVFNVHIKAKRYAQAKRCYDNARDIALFIGLETEKMEALFGMRGNRGLVIKEGLFKEELVQKAYFETCVKAKQAPENCVLCQERLKGAV